MPAVETSDEQNGSKRAVPEVVGHDVAKRAVPERDVFGRDAWGLAEAATDSISAAASTAAGSEAPALRTRLIGLLPISLIAFASGLLCLWGLTRSGFANTYYAEAAQAASRSWAAWLTNATDASLSVSLDKGPLPNMMLGLSGRLFGFSSFSLLLPEALCGIGSVLLLYDAVRRTLGRRAAMLAAAMLALTPIFVAMSRFDNPDALLVLLEVAAAWALVRALRSGRTRWVLLCGALVGLAFNVKMLQAYLIVPGLAAALLLAGQGAKRRRLAQLAAGGAAMLAVSFAWYGPMMLVPADSRPWVGDTTDNSWFSLIFGANGFGRVSGEGPGGGFGGANFGGHPGLTRLLDDALGGQIAWLLPLAAIGFFVGLWSTRRFPRTDPRRAAYVLWGGWALVTGLVFSLAEGVFHPYYTTALAPAVAVLAAGGLVTMWDRARQSTPWLLALGAALVVAALLARDLLARTPSFAAYLAPTVLALAVVAVSLLLLARLLEQRTPGRRTPGQRRLGQRTPGSSHRRALLGGAALAALLAVLAGPAAYSIATAGRRLSGGNPLAGPQPVRGGRPLLAGVSVRPVQSPAAPGGSPTNGVPPPGAPGGSPTNGVPPPIGGSPPLGAPPPIGSSRPRRAVPAHGRLVSVALVGYLEAHQGRAKYLVAAEGSLTAAAIALRSRREAIDMGGFMGADPAPSLSKLRSLIESGQLHYVLLGGPNAVGLPGAGAGYQALLAGKVVLGPTAALVMRILERDDWVREHGTAVRVPGQGAGLRLYYVG